MQVVENGDFLIYKIPPSDKTKVNVVSYSYMFEPQVCLLSPCMYNFPSVMGGSKKTTSSHRVSEP